MKLRFAATAVLLVSLLAAHIAGLSRLWSEVKFNFANFDLAGRMDDVRGTLRVTAEASASIGGAERTRGSPVHHPSFLKLTARATWAMTVSSTLGSSHAAHTC